jgi:Fe-S-cluster containining protein
MEKNIPAPKHFIDGDGTCSGCGNRVCCRVVVGLLVTPGELESVPLMKEFICGFDGTFYLLNMPKGCPYHLPGGLCGVFADRPFDCSLFPVYIVRIEKKPGKPAVTVVYSWGGGPEDRMPCEKRDDFIRKGLSPEQMDRLRNWISRALGTPEIVLEDSAVLAERAQSCRSRKEHCIEAGKSLLRAAGLFHAARRLVKS